MSTDTVAVDVERLTTRLVDMFRVTRTVDGAPIDMARSDAEEVVRRWLEQGVVQDAAAVRHEHGERIAKALGEVAHGVLEGTYVGLHYRDTVPAAVHKASRIARDLSPPPSRPGVR